VTTEVKPVLTSQTRLWLQEDGAGPANAPAYQGRARATGLNMSAGALTPIRSPASTQYGKFVTVGTLRGAPDLPTVTFESRYEPEVISAFLSLFNKQCEFDAQLHMGDCENPQDFASGWTVVRVFEQLEPSTFSNGELGTFDEGGNTPILDSLEVAAQRIYDVSRLRASEIAAAEITDEVVDVTICDSITCGQCGRVSDGCQIVFLLVGETSGSPGLPAELLYSEDGGATWGTTTITTLGLAEAPRRMICVGTNLIVISLDSASLHYASINDILDGVETWTEMLTGWDAAGDPRAITSSAIDRTWIAGQAGRIYFTTDPTSSVTEQADGSQTAQDLNDIHALDRNNVVAVGNSNAILVTANGGTTWSLVVGPAVGVNLNAIWMRSSLEWLVGSAAGVLYYTRNGGTTWSTKGFAGSGTGSVEDIKFASRVVGYMSHTTAAGVGRVLRTIDGGFSWKVLPEQEGLTTPDNDRINALAPCVDDVNVLFAAGLGANGSDGIALKFA
jgi:photosystem II stability/assembly factor-like uncharacterized protein